MIAVNAVWQVSKTWTEKPLVQGFVGAVLAAVLMFGAVKAYGWARWEVYGKNEQRLTQAEQVLGNVVHYLQAQEAAKAAGGK
jgi:hypothetical protein